MSTTYYDQAGRRRTSAIPVPIDQHGQVTGAQYRCRKCKATKWVSPQTAQRGAPVCDNDALRMIPAPITGPAALPWSSIGGSVSGQLKAVWVGAAVGAVGAGAASAHVPPVVAVLAAVPAGVITARVVQRGLTSRAKKRGHLADDDQGHRRRTVIARYARQAGIYAGLAVVWVALAAAVGVDTTTTGGKTAWTVFVALWAAAAATWWRRLRQTARRRPEPAPDTDLLVAGAADVPMHPDEAQTRRVWDTILAAPKNQARPDRGGRLAGTRLEDWHPVTGGWAATAVGPDGAYTADTFVGARSSIASAYRMKTSMITVIPDTEDENRALVLAQRSSPIRDVIIWPGPDTIDAQAGTGPAAVYADGETSGFELYRRGWGCPHVGVFGTTGSGKSEFLNQLFTLDRWMATTDPATGERRGLVASFLIDPQQGQSFAPFLDDLAGPVAATIDEAKTLVAALAAEMLRRNVYLTRHVKTWDEKRQIWRTGRKWWDPTVDGPILTLTIDEAHAYLADREFTHLLTAAGRMWRKCGGQIRVATHTPLLADLGGSMALRDMLTGGYVAVFRTANSLSGPVAFNGRLPVDPRTIPAQPGSCYILTGAQPKPMLARAMWVPDYYDWVRDERNEPIGYPAELPPETLSAFGPEYAAWVAASRAGELFIPSQRTAAPAPVEAPATCVSRVLQVLAAAAAPMDMAQLDEQLRQSGAAYTVRTVRDALKQLRTAGKVLTVDSRHELTAAAREELSAADSAAGVDGLSDVS